MQAGLHASGNEWVSLHRDYDRRGEGRPTITTGGTNELPMRNQYRSWVERMTETM
jgi:benzoate/toluate 1,2-dioxygenase alpha subunit